jgi:flagellar hook-length control protein FliK
MQTQPTRAAEWPPSGGGSIPKTASTQLPGTDFLALLNQSQARTAPAEGHKREIEKDRTPRDTRRDDRVHSERPQRRDADHTRRTDEREPVIREAAPEPVASEQPATEAPAAETSQTAEQNAAGGQGSATPQGQQPAAQQPQAPVADGEVAPVTQAQVATLPLAEGAGVIVDPALVAATPGTAAPVVGGPAVGPVVVDPAAVVAAAAATAGKPATGEAVATTVADPAAAAVPVTGTAATALDAAAAAAVTTEQGETATPTTADPAAAATVKAETPAEAKPAEQQQAHAAPAADRTPAGTGQQGQQPQGDQPKQQQPQTQQQPQAAAAVAAQAEQASQNDGSSSQSTSGQSQPVAGPAGPSVVYGQRNPAARATPVHISNAAEAVENTIRIASQRGVTHAKLALKPAELGGVEIRLLQTAAGLSATVMADSPEAAKLLQQAGQDLRNSLEAQGVQLQNLDISYSGDESQSAAQAFSELRQGNGRSQDGRGSGGNDPAVDSDPTDNSQPSTIELPDGVLVDVLA